MPNITVVLREEIVRLARKEIRRQTGILRKASAQYRKDIAALKRRVADLQRKVVPLEKQMLKGVSSPVPQVDTERVRYSARSLGAQRRRLGLSAADYGKLIGVTGQTIYSWEQGKSRPRKQQVARLATARSLGKREAHARLEQLAAKTRKKRK